jgi:2'-5' RNA ligase
MRLFIAALPPKQIRRELAEVKNDFNGFPAKWVEEKNLHLTLVFIGEIGDRPPARFRRPRRRPRSRPSPSQIADDRQEIQTQLNKISKQVEKAAEELPPIKLKTDGVALFPDEHKARLLVVNLTGETAKLHALAEDLKRQLQAAKIDFDEKPFHPHITLARLKRIRPRKKRNIRQKVDDYEMQEETFDVNKIILLESKLTQNGPIYKTMPTALRSDRRDRMKKRRGVCKQ